MNNLSPLAQKIVMSISSLAVPTVAGLVAFNVLNTAQATAVTGIIAAISTVLHTVWEPSKPEEPK